MKWSSRQYFIAFNMVPGIGGRRLQALEKFFGSLANAWHAPKEELLKIRGIGPKTLEGFARVKASICPIREEKWASRQNARIVTLQDEEYPEFLQRLAVPPPVLYVSGKLPKQKGIAVVGSRRPSSVGVAQAKGFSGYLAKNGEVIISGLARGIDFHAHMEALHQNARTVAVIGSNLRNLYPAEHRDLVQKIVANNGAVISEFSSHCATVPGNFPRRNRIIAGLSRGVLVVQAGLKSGALGTADWALELGIDVWTIPGEIHDPLRAGNHNLIKQGAFLVTNPKELMNSELIINENEFKPTVKSLFEAGCHANEIAARLNIPIGQILAELSILQVEHARKV